MKFYCIRYIENETLKIFFCYAESKIKAKERFINITECNKITSITIIGE